MDPTLRETLDLVIRWIHLIAGIMWVGNSMLFNWLDRNLVKPEGANERMIGEMWMLHSGGFYQVEKKYLAPSEMPKVLHWFKWQSYTTWLSGFLLLVVVYYLSGGAYLVDPSVYDISPGKAAHLGMGLLLLGFAGYDLLWRSPLRTRPRAAVAVSLAGAAGMAWIFLHVFSARAAYMHFGAMLGSVMAGNVFFHIVPSQKQMVAATVAGEMADPALGAHAKERSIHNNYITFPVLFIMVSNHFPSTWGNQLNWLVLAILVVGGATVRHFMNSRWTYPRWLPALLVSAVLTIGGTYLLIRPQSAPATASATGSSPAASPAAMSGTPGQERVVFPVAQAIINQRCTPCHSATPTDPLFKAPPNGIQLDTPERIHALAARIKIRAVDQKTMPMANRTGITAEERALLGRWLDEGANVK